MAPTMPSRTFLSTPPPAFMNMLASQPARPPMMMAASQPTPSKPIMLLLSQLSLTTTCAWHSGCERQERVFAAPADGFTRRPAMRQDGREDHDETIAHDIGAVRAASIGADPAA